MNQQMYRMLDENPSGMFRTHPNEAKEWNEKGFGIFLTVNDFSGERRITNLKRVNAWAVDLDTGTKDEMAAKIRSGLTPSLVVETKRGFHCWWVAKDAEAKYWNAIVLDRLVPFYGADKNARDLCRVLRAPGFLHLKDPKDPFLVQEVFRYEVSYSQEQVRRFYPDRFKEDRDETIKRAKSEAGMTDDFWENVWRLDCMEALQRLSGSDHVGGETYTFRRNTNGNYNIFVNGKGTSCFIDHNFRIGSLSKGGPSIYQWLCWYGIKPGDVASIIKNTFPETVVKNDPSKI